MYRPNLTPTIMKTPRIFPSLLLLALALLCVAPTTAQHFQIKAGGGFARHYKDSRIVGAFKAGVGFEYEFNQRWTFNPALCLYGKGWKYPDQTVPFLTPDGQPEYDEQGNQRMSVMSRTTTANYIEVPLVFNYYQRVGEGRYVVLAAGPYVAYGISGKSVTKGDTSRPGSEKMYYEGKAFKEPGVKRFDAGLQVMLGYQFASSLIVGLETDLGVLPYNAAADRNISGIVSLSYRF